LKVSESASGNPHFAPAKEFVAGVGNILEGFGAPVISKCGFLNTD